MKSSHLLAFAALLGLTGSLSAAWTRLPDVAARPVDLASKAMPGTKIMASRGVDEAGNLLSSDPALATHVHPGKSELTVRLANQNVLETVTFVNDGMEGQVTCAGSPDERKWTDLGRATFTANDRVVAVTFASAQARYLSVSFESAQGGTIRGLHVYGRATSRDYVLKKSDSTANVNMAGGAGGSHAIYANPSPSNLGELDAKNNVFRFPNTGDKYRVVIYDLGAPRTLHEFSTAYSQHPVRLEVFAFQELPEKKDWRGKLTLDPVIFDQARPVATGEDARGVGHIKVVPSKPVTAQFIALRFQPNYMRGTTMTNSFWGDLAQAGLGSAAPVLEALDLLPQVQFTAAGDGGFLIGDINLGGSGMSCVPGNGNGDNGVVNGPPGSTPGTDPRDAAPPYLTGTPGAPPAGTGTLPVSGGGVGSGNSGNTPANVNVTVSGAGNSSNGGGTNAGPPTNNNPGTNNP